jgi:hypothetical protein
VRKWKSGGEVPSGSERSGAAFQLWRCAGWLLLCCWCAPPTHPPLSALLVACRSAPHCEPLRPDLSIYSRQKQDCTAQSGACVNSANAHTRLLAPNLQIGLEIFAKLVAGDAERVRLLSLGERVKNASLAQRCQQFCLPHTCFKRKNRRSQNEQNKSTLVKSSFFFISSTGPRMLFLQ